MNKIKITAIFLTVFFSLITSLYANEGVKLKWVVKNKLNDKKIVKNSKSDKIEEDSYKEYFSNRTTLDSSNWYFKLSLTVSYINLGSEIKSELDRVEGAFSGSELGLSLLHLDTKMKLKTDESVSRAKTNFLPTGNIGFGYMYGNHRFEFNMGTAALVPLKTIDIHTQATMTETGEKILDVPNMESLGFVGADKTGRYQIDAVMNEKVWVLAPEFSYDYTFKKTSFGDLFAGSSFGVMIFSLRQQVSLKMERLDIEEGHSRIIESDVLSTVMNDFGPIGRLYIGIKRELFGGINTDFKIGINYGFATLHRDVDGTGTVNMDGNMYTSFPVTSLSVDNKKFKSKEINRLEMAGIFIQAGILF